MENINHYGDFMHLCMEEIKELLKCNEEVDSWIGTNTSSGNALSTETSGSCKKQGEDGGKVSVLLRVLDAIEFLDTVIEVQRVRPAQFAKEKLIWTCLAELIKENLPTREEIEREL